MLHSLLHVFFCCNEKTSLDTAVSETGGFSGSYGSRKMFKNQIDFFGITALHQFRISIQTFAPDLKCTDAISRNEFPFIL